MSAVTHPPKPDPAAAKLYKYSVCTALVISELLESGRPEMARVLARELPVRLAGEIEFAFAKG